jgi:hypothetical protein
VGYGGNTSLRSLFGSQGVSSSNTYGSINTSKNYFSMMKPNCFAQITKSSHIMNTWIRKHQLVGTNVIAKASESRKGRH